MRTLIDGVIRPLAAFLLAAVVANCNDGCIGYGPIISPAEAYAMEVSGCVEGRNKEVLACAGDASTADQYLVCKADAEEKERKCRAQVDRKYLNYNSNGSYPGEQYPPSR